MESGEESHHSTLDEILYRRRRKRLLGTLTALALLLSAVGLYLIVREPPRPATPPEPPAHSEPRPIPIATPLEQPTPPPVAPPEPAAPVAVERPAPFTAPSLDESDPLVRQLSNELSHQPDWTTSLAASDLVRRFVAAVDNIAEGKSPKEHLDHLRPKKKFAVAEDEHHIGIDPASYARYDLLSDVLVSLDVRAAAALYRKLQPLIEQAYADLGYPDRRFDETLAAAIRELLQTPVLVGEVALSPRVISYEYSDPEIEELSQAQKQLLRTGPSNAPRLQRKLRELAGALGIPKSALPKSRIHELAAPSTP